MSLCSIQKNISNVKFETYCIDYHLPVNVENGTYDAFISQKVIGSS
jgi:hypothetical protein